MEYLLLIYEAEEIWENKSDQEKRAVLREHMALHDRLEADGRAWSGRPLMPTSTATSLRIRAGRRELMDGPFAETKEQLAGFYLVDADGIEQALEYASLIPTTRHGTVEVRRVADYGAYA